MRRSLLALSTALTLACGHASIWSQDAAGGVLTLHGAEAEAMHDAHTKMTAHCGPRGFQIVRRDTVVVGQRTSTHHTTDASAHRDTTHKPRPVGTSTTTRTDGQTRTTATTTVENINEVRLTYQCLSVAS